MERGQAARALGSGRPRELAVFRDSLRGGPSEGAGGFSGLVESDESHKDQPAAQEQENGGQHLNQHHLVHLTMPPYRGVRSGQVQSFAAFSPFDKSFFVFFSPLCRIH